MASRCVHVWERLVDPVSDDGRFYVLLRRLNRYFVCSACGRLGYYNRRCFRPKLVSSPPIEAMIRERAAACPE